MMLTCVVMVIVMVMNSYILSVNGGVVRFD